MSEKVELSVAEEDTGKKSKVQDLGETIVGDGVDAESGFDVNQVGVQYRVSLTGNEHRGSRIFYLGEIECVYAHAEPEVNASRILSVEQIHSHASRIAPNRNVRCLFFPAYLGGYVS